MTTIRVHQGRLEDQKPPIIIDGPQRRYASHVVIRGSSTIIWRPDPSGAGGRVWVQTDSEIEIQE